MKPVPLGGGYKLFCYSVESAVRPTVECSKDVKSTLDICNSNRFRTTRHIINFNFDRYFEELVKAGIVWPIVTELHGSYQVISH